MIILFSIISLLSFQNTSKVMASLTILGVILFTLILISSNLSSGFINIYFLFITFPSLTCINAMEQMESALVFGFSISNTT